MSSDTSIKTILILAANPASTSRLRLDEEVREIDEGLRRANKREQFRLEQKWAVRQRDFYRAILDYQPQIVHFSGHGTGEDGIVLEDEVGQPALVDANAISSMFEVFSTNGVECVVLNACFSKEQAEAISQHINYVIGMNRAIGDRRAINFAVAFYDTLAAGKGVEDAFKLGCSQIKEHDNPVLKKRAVVVPAKSNFIPPNPYQGLFAFGEEDAEFFFGRYKFVDTLVQVTYKQPLVTVIGSSGSGKSSVVFAGLISRLRVEATYLIESFRPSDKPFYQLASALIRQLEPELSETKQLIEATELAAKIQKGKLTLQQVVSRIIQKNKNKHLLLVADQFEELYTLCQDQEEQQRFVDICLEAIHQKSLTLVLTLRSDFCDCLLSYLPFGNALQQFPPQFLVAMKWEELKAAIEKPAEKLKVQLQVHLTERILNDVGQEPGNLPLLEFALTELWKKQQNRELTHKAYDEIGGVKKALVKHAEEVYSKLSKPEQQSAQRIFLSLVCLGEGKDDTKRVASSAEVGKENWRLVSYLAGSEARLVVTGRRDKSTQTVEVVHEALIREWGRLRKWLSENREKLIQQRKIEAACIEWIDKEKSKDYLLQSKQLIEARVFQQEQTPNSMLSDLACEFIQTSIKHRRNNRLKLVVGSTITLGLAVFLGTLVERKLTTNQLQQIVKDARGKEFSGERNRALEKLVKLGVKINSDLSTINLKDTNFSDGFLDEVNFSNANLIGTNFYKAQLNGANFYKADLRVSDLNGASLNKANLSFANLSFALPTNAHLFGSVLIKTDLRKANLSGSVLIAANLSDADLRDADLSGAYFGGANLSHVKLNGANLRGTDFSSYSNYGSAKNLTQEQVKAAKNWQQAIYDKDFCIKLGLQPELAKDKCVDLTENIK